METLKAPEEGPEHRTTQAGGLYAPAAVAAATLFGSPIIGTLFLAENCRRQHRFRLAALVLVAGVLATAAGIATIAYLWGQPAAWLVPVLWAGLMFLLAHRLEGTSHGSQAARSESRARSWQPLLAGLGVSLFIAALAGAHSLIPKPRVYHSSAVGDIPYSGDATEADAARLARAFQDDILVALFVKTDSVYLRVRENTVTVSVYLDSSGDPRTSVAFTLLIRDTCEKAFLGKEVRVRPRW